MSKAKSVSDILKPVVIFPTGESSYMSARFEVRNHPVLIKAFGIDCDTIGHIEMGYSDGCGGWFWGPYVPDCDQIAVLGCANALAIGMPGWYRIVFRDRVTKQPLTGLDDLIVTVTETDMPANMLAQFTGGSASMGCGSQVSIREDEDGCFYISVDNQGFKICPGDHVSCDPNGLGIVINGVLCPFPVQTEVSASINEDGCLTIVIDGEAVTLCNSITLVNSLGDGQFEAINPDGSVVTWDGENSVTTVSEFDDGQFRAVNPDGSTVDWNGNDSITLADVNTIDKTITITNPDGSTVTFYYLEDEPVQTEVSNGTGSLANQNTYEVDHKGTWPNETIHTPWLVRNGDLVTVNVWNPTMNRWDAIAVDAPENIVILNNPVIHLNSATGTANPPINDQADLTPANAFNSFDSVRSFMRRTLTVGTVTLECSGTFTGAGAIGPEQYKNAQLIVVRGAGGDASAASIQWGGGGASDVGSQISGGSVIFRDITFEATNGAPTNYAAAVNIANGARCSFDDTVRFTGMYNETNKAPAYLIRNVDGGLFQFESNMTAQFAMAAGTVLTYMALVAAPSRLAFGGSVQFQFSVSRINCEGRPWIELTAGAVMTMRTSKPSATEPLAVSGGQRPIAGNSVRVRPLSVVNSAGAYGNRAAMLAYDFGPQVTAGGASSVMEVDAIGVVNDVAGP